MKYAKSFFKSLSEGIHKTNEGQNNGWTIGDSVEKFCNVGGVYIVPLTPLMGGSYRTPEA